MQCNCLYGGALKGNQRSCFECRAQSVVSPARWLLGPLNLRRRGSLPGLRPTRHCQRSSQDGIGTGSGNLIRLQTPSRHRSAGDTRVTIQQPAAKLFCSFYAEYGILKNCRSCWECQGYKDSSFTLSRMLSSSPLRSMHHIANRESSSLTALYLTQTAWVLKCINA